MISQALTAALSSQTKDPATSKRLSDLKKACEQFESVFAKQLVGEMRKGVKSSLDQMPGASVYQDMMDQAIGDSMAHQGALGIGKLLYKQFEKQVAASAAPSLNNLAAGSVAIEKKKDQ